MQDIHLHAFLILLFLLLSAKILWILYFLVNIILLAISLFFNPEEERFLRGELFYRLIAILITFCGPFLRQRSLFLFFNALLLPINIFFAIDLSLSVLFEKLTPWLPVLITLLWFLDSILIPAIRLLGSILTDFFNMLDVMTIIFENCWRTVAIDNL